MQNPNKEENDGKKRYNFRIQDDTMILIQQWYKADNCTTMNEFVEKAIRFYAGYVASEHNPDYFPSIVIATMKSIIRDSENRYNRNLYRIAMAAITAELYRSYRTRPLQQALLKS